jgi:TPP-dependent indolepyruvate ferredoxin oxidoreductase alpha subunit
MINGSKTEDRPTVYIDSAKCTGCGVCVKKIGCPAMSIENNKAVINSSLCAGCLLCVNLCPVNAINFNVQLKDDVIKILEEVGDKFVVDDEDDG